MMNWVSSGYEPGSWVEVKSAREIVATLDKHSALDDMPFMPEMLQYCGRRFQVLKSAHKTCDTVNQTGGRRVQRAVHLDTLRCDGSAHGGCQAGCLIFWKTDWLRPAEQPDGGTESGIEATDSNDLLETLAGSARKENSTDVEIFSCQATRLFDASEPLKSTQVVQYVADVKSGNVRLRDASKILFLAGIYRLRNLGVGYRIAVRLYDFLHRIVYGRDAPKWAGNIPAGQRTPDERLNLEVDELVSIKSMDEIRETLDTNGRNRGLTFDPEMAPYCGGTYRVAARVEKIVNEKTGEMMHFKNPCIVLDQVYCMGIYSAFRLMCPRRITSYWREIWLRRAVDAAGTAGQSD